MRDVRCGPWCLVALAGLALPGSSAWAQTTAFRFSDLDLRDPHVTISIVGCRDVTDTAFAGFSVNGQLQAQIQGDTDGDNVLDLSSLVLFQPLDQQASGNPFDYGAATCSAPLAATSCGQFVSAGNGALAGTAALLNSGICLEALPGTTFGYTPAVPQAQAPCFLSPAGTLNLDLGDGITVPLRSAQLGARFDAVPALTLSNGVLTGFVSEADADATLLPATLPLIGGRPLSSVLPGGTGNCSGHSDKDEFQGQSGWWFYLQFSAVAVPLAAASPEQILRDGFEAVP